MFQVHRRSFLAGLGLLIAAPAIVRASSLMPVKALAVEQPPFEIPVGGLSRFTFLNDRGEVETIIRHGGLIRQGYRGLVQPTVIRAQPLALPPWAQPIHQG